MDFALFMLLALGATGMVWLADALFAKPARARAAEQKAKAGASAEEVEHAYKESLLVEYARAFFPVILLVFLFRSFLVEPFRIPSGSMIPSLLIGDFILVNKFTYGLRVPVLNRKILDLGRPKHGDVMVFRFPGDPSQNFIKRVIGLPGDHVVYKDKKLYINGVLMEQRPLDDYSYSEGRDSQGNDLQITSTRMQENLDGVEHSILLSDGPDQMPKDIVVPEHQYFVMGDNRDRSNDSRFWGTVPEQNIVGKAFLIWFSWDIQKGGPVSWSRIGDSVH
jgi:signal peptidase I